MCFNGICLHGQSTENYGVTVKVRYFLLEAVRRRRPSVAVLGHDHHRGDCGAPGQAGLRGQANPLCRGGQAGLSPLGRAGHQPSGKLVRILAPGLLDGGSKPPSGGSFGRQSSTVTGWGRAFCPPPLTPGAHQGRGSGNRLQNAGEHRKTGMAGGCAGQGHHHLGELGRQRKPEPLLPRRGVPMAVRHLRGNPHISSIVGYAHHPLAG